MGGFGQRPRDLGDIEFAHASLEHRVLLDHEHMPIGDAAQHDEGVPPRSHLVVSEP